VRVALSTGGGDAPGLNAVIRAVVKSAHNHGIACLGLEDSFDGLIEPNRHRVLTPKDVTGILRVGGTILGTVNRGNPFLYPIETSDGKRDYSQRCIDMFHQLGLDGLVVIGGDGTLAIAHEFAKRGIPLVGVPKTIDNDIVETTNCFGFDTAVSFATDAIDRLHTTAEAHHRVMVAEVMGRYAGWIALHAGVAGGADAILIPEIPYDIEKVCEKIRDRDRSGRLFSIVVVAEGAIPVGGRESIMGKSMPGQDRRVGGLAGRLAYDIQQRTGKETRSLVLRHLQRGGMPTGYDRLLATRFGGAAVRAVADGKWGHMVALQSPNIVTVPIVEVLKEAKQVDPKHDVVLTARSTGISFGD
jgi:ATP-dependent phosphofructokinase / diphosphate-dependent phosphofructokinase